MTTKKADKKGKKDKKDTSQLLDVLVELPDVKEKKPSYAELESMYGNMTRHCDRVTAEREKLRDQLKTVDMLIQPSWRELMQTVQLHVYMSAALHKSAAKLNLSIPSPPFSWTTLIRSCYGEFGVDWENGFGFRLKPTEEALNSVLPILTDVLQKATPRTLRCVVEYDTADRALGRIVEPWRQRLFNLGFEVL